MDLLSEVSKKLSFKYQVQLVKDGSYGRQDESGNWNGMIGEVMRGVSTRKPIFGERNSAVTMTAACMCDSWLIQRWMWHGEYVHKCRGEISLLFIPYRKRIWRLPPWPSRQPERKWWQWPRPSCRRALASCWGGTSWRKPVSLIFCPPSQPRLGLASWPRTWAPPLASLWLRGLWWLSYNYPFNSDARWAAKDFILAEGNLSISARLSYLFTCEKKKNLFFFYPNVDSAHTNGASLRMSRTRSASCTASGTQLELWLYKVHSIPNKHRKAHGLKGFADLQFFLHDIRCWSSPQSSVRTRHLLHVVVF